MTDARFELVVFDCDGVLVDSERLALAVEVALLGELGWAVDPDEIVERFVGRSDAYMLAGIEEALGRPVPDWPDRYRAALSEAFHRELRPVPGVVAALDVLGDRVATCIASSGTHEKLALTLGLCGLHDRFQGRIFSTTEVAAGKPAPDLFLHAAARCGVEPSRCAVVEDSPYGVEAALAAGMTPFAFAGSVVPAHRLAGPGVTVFDDMADLPGLLGR